MIVVSGEALVDLVIDVDGSVVAKLGGGPFNAARTIGRLGGQVAFLGALSNDRFGSLLRRKLADDGVGLDLVTAVELPTTLAAAELSPEGAASYRFYLDSTSAPALALTDLPDGVRALHVGTLGLVLEPMATVVEQLVRSAGDEVLVFADPNCRPRVTTDRDGYLARLGRVLSRSDVVKVSTDDLDFLSPGVEHRASARALLAQGPQVVLLTAGGDGAWVITADHTELVPARPVTVADTIGAGDSFGGAFLHWWTANGLGRADLTSIDLLMAATRAGVEVAGRTCEQVGAEPPHAADLGANWLAR